MVFKVQGVKVSLVYKLLNNHIKNLQLKAIIETVMLVTQPKAR